MQFDQEPICNPGRDKRYRCIVPAQFIEVFEMSPTSSVPATYLTFGYWIHRSRKLFFFSAVLLASR